MGLPIADAIHELLATEAAIEKLGAPSIVTDEAGQILRNAMWSSTTRATRLVPASGGC